MQLPRLLLVRQRFAAPSVGDLGEAVAAQLRRARLLDKIRPGHRVAVTCGSRGIACIAEILRCVCEQIKAAGGRPFIVPAMGSHGGATAEGQAQVLAHFGVTEERVAAPIRSCMDVVEIGRSRFGFPVYLDAHAAGADHIVVVNRIKPHTRFIGPVESGLMKMMLIGLGKHRGAQVYHAAIVDYDWKDIVDDVARVVIERAPIACGLAILENAYDQTAKLVGLEPREFHTREPDLLREAERLMAKLPFEQGDLLVVDEMGKEFSGLGMDPYVTGVKSNSPVRMKRIYVRSLTEHTYGNANGVGYADFTHRRLVDRIDRRAMYTNAVTAAKPANARIPIWFDTDRECVEAALQTIGLTPPQRARVMWIKNTMELERLLVSEAYREELDARDDLEMLGEIGEWPFDAEGQMPWAAELLAS